MSATSISKEVMKTRNGSSSVLEALPLSTSKLSKSPDHDDDATAAMISRALLTKTRNGSSKEASPLSSTRASDSIVEKVSSPTSSQALNDDDHSFCGSITSSRRTAFVPKRVQQIQGTNDTPTTLISKVPSTKTRNGSNLKALPSFSRRSNSSIVEVPSPRTPTRSQPLDHDDDMTATMLSKASLMKTRKGSSMEASPLSLMRANDPIMEVSSPAHSGSQSSLRDDDNCSSAFNESSVTPLQTSVFLPKQDSKKIVVRLAFGSWFPKEIKTPSCVINFDENNMVTNGRKPFIPTESVFNRIISSTLNEAIEFFKLCKTQVQQLVAFCDWFLPCSAKSKRVREHVEFAFTHDPEEPIPADQLCKHIIEFVDCDRINLQLDVSCSSELGSVARSLMMQSPNVIKEIKSVRSMVGNMLNCVDQQCQDAFLLDADVLPDTASSRKCLTFQSKSAVDDMRTAIHKRAPNTIVGEVNMSRLPSTNVSQLRGSQHIWRASHHLRPSHQVLQRHMLMALPHLRHVEWRPCSQWQR